MVEFIGQLETNLVLVRPVNPDDYDRFAEISADKELWTYFTSDLSDKYMLRNWIESGIQDMKNKSRFMFTIIEKETNLMAGSSSIGNISERDKRAEIGWTWLGREFHGKGINDQVKYLLLKYCFENLDFERVEFKTDVLNHPARNALKRIGAIEEGVLRSHTLMTNNRRRDTIYYSILRHEWNDIKNRNNWP